MTQKLEELFNLPQDETEETVDAIPATETIQAEIITTEALSNLEKIDDALPSIKGLEAADSEMDEIAAMAVGSYKDLIDLGMNVEARVASDILSSASQFLGHAITAKNAKINKKLKMLDLQLKKAKLDADALKNKPAGEDETTGTGKALDRNELLAEILKQAKAEAAKKEAE